MSGVLDLDRAGLWRRLIAYAVDVALAYTLFYLLAAVAFSATGGAVFATSYFDTGDCRPEATMPAGGPSIVDLSARGRVTTPRPQAPGSQNRIQRCDVSFLGLPAGRFVTGLTIVETGSEFRMNFRTVALDSEGRPRRAWSLDPWLFPFLVLMRALSDALGGSPGRRVVRIKLVDGYDADDRAPARPPLPMLAARYLLFAAPALPALLVPPDFQAAMTFPTVGGILSLIGWAFLVSLPGLITTVAAVVAIVRGEDAYYDRWSTTQVRRLR